MRPFAAHDGRYVARLSDVERAVLADLTAGVGQLLGEPDLDASPQPWQPTWPADTAPEQPQDPAVRRLLPDASTDPAEADEFRRLVGDDVRRRKVDGLRALHRALRSPQGRRGDEVVVTPATADAVAAAFTDLRLVLAERLEIRSDEDGERIYAELAEPRQEPGRDDVRRAFVAMYDVLSVLQETLVTLMLDDARRGTSHPPRRGTGREPG